MNRFPSFLLFLCSLFSVSAGALDWQAQFGVEGRYFLEESFAADYQANASAWVRPEVYYEWNDGYDRLTFIGFYRWDENDEERTHGDVREAHWLHIGEYWETRIGIGKVFWGVTESQHLVDIINQTDLVESPDGEEKLGQPMFSFSTAQDQVLLDFFVLPYFRERTFPGPDGRLQFPIPVDPDEALYESDDEESHIDFALRYAIIADDFEVALSYFKGTSRDPEFRFNNNPADPKLIPYYPQIDQVGVVSQVVAESWLWKFEGIYRSGFGEESYVATTAGFEYTQAGVFNSDIDLGWLAEFLWDERGDDATNTFFERDVFLGWRFGFNDINSTEILSGAIVDIETGEQFYLVEASRRVFSYFTLSAEARLFEGGDPLPESLPERLSQIAPVADNKTAALQKEDFIQVELTYYF